ncbi:MAG: DUF4160 domain-containing protein [Ignavibacteria bacterium]|nr:DUF4160 domain-containing protein [Ignavibacteria bacterium]MCC7158491.1 DUF4160 domain-containing protein [Ignavibacteria bacterium]
MPQISRFFGIIISMYFGDHNPPHFHAKYGDQEALISIDDLSIIEGRINKRAYELVKEWALMHKSELQKDWELVKNFSLPEKIEPLS